MWLVKQEPASHRVLQQHRMLLREFNNTEPQIIMVVNGVENYDDEWEKAERMQEDRQKGYEFGLERARAAGISVSKMIISTTKPDLRATADDVYYSLGIFTPKESSFKSYADLEKVTSDLKTASEKVQYEIKKMNEKIEKMKSDIEEEKEFASTVRSVAWKTWWVPIAGQVGAVGLALRANKAESFAGQLEKQLSIENNHT